MGRGRRWGQGKKERKAAFEALLCATHCIVPGNAKVTKTLASAQSG